MSQKSIENTTLLLLLGLLLCVAMRDAGHADAIASAATLRATFATGVN